MKQGLLFSGGLDSLIAYEYLKRKPDLVYFALGHKYEQREMQAIQTLKDRGHIESVILADFINLGYFEDPDSFIGMRNLYLIMGMASLGYDTITLVVQEDEMSIPDRTQKFFMSTAEQLSEMMGKEIKIFTPFIDMDKTDMVSWWRTQGLTTDALETSSSCYASGTGKQCGNCPACYRKAVALTLNNYRIDFFKRNPILSPIGMEYYKKRDKYSFKRRQRIEDAYKLNK